MTQYYFHELTDEEHEELKRRGTTWAECAKHLAQPPWCTYPNAVSGLMGCWSLTYRGVHDESFCRGCECYKVSGHVDK